MRRQREGEVVLTPNQVVAYNLARARLYRGWTQEEAGEALAPYLGTRWSVANFSAIERSVDGGRIRQFTADELFALARGFGLPIGFFLTPPGDDPRRVRIATPDTKKHGGVEAMELLDAVLGTDESLSVWEDVLAAVSWPAGHRAALEDGKVVTKGRVVADQLPRARRLAALRARTLLRREFGDTETARAVLTRLVGLLEQLDADEAQVSGEAEESTPRRPPRRARRKPTGPG
ncbi:MAG: helix-turn-helix transcriptional regulator [Actinomycetota bacterium]|nr:helix-turn-helix transcriptional regulator [Actinomycetota bacterium]